MPKVVLTAPLVAGPLAQGSYYDQVLPNFGLRVGKRRRTYFVRVREHGRRVRLTLGHTSTRSLKEARLAAAEKLRQHGEGQLLRPLALGVQVALTTGQLDPATLTMKELCDAFIQDHAQIWSTSHLKNSRFFANHIVGIAWGTRLATSMTRQEIRILERNYAARAPTNANRLHAFLSRLFRWAQQEELLDDVPILNMRKPVKERSRERLLTVDEIRQFWSALDAVAACPTTTRRDRSFLDLWRLRLLTAQREQSLRFMEWSWVHFQDKALEIPADAMKGKAHVHLVPLGPMALAILERRRDAASKLDKFVFGTRDAASTAPGRTRGVPVALPNFKGHDLRRTATTLMAQHGVSRFDVARVLNHRDGSVTGVYDRYEYFAEKQRALTTLDRALTAILHPAAAPTTVLPFVRG